MSIHFEFQFRKGQTLNFVSILQNVQKMKTFSRDYYLLVVS